MAYKQDQPPSYGPPPGAPQPTYGGYQQDPYQQQGQSQSYYQPAPQMGYYQQQPQQGPFPGGQGPYPPQPAPYGAQPQGYYPQERENKSGGILTGLMAGLACCCCLDCLF